MLSKHSMLQLVQDMETVMQEAKKIARIKALAKKRNVLMQKVRTLDGRINALLSGKAKGKKGTTGKLPSPKVGSGPYKLCKVMSSRPMLRKEIAKKTGLTEGTVKFYLRKYACFKLAGWGKGYIYIKDKAK